MNKVLFSIVSFCVVFLGFADTAFAMTDNAVSSYTSESTGYLWQSLGEGDNTYVSAIDMKIASTTGSNYIWQEGSPVILEYSCSNYETNGCNGTPVGVLQRIEVSPSAAMYDSNSNGYIDANGDYLVGSYNGVIDLHYVFSDLMFRSGKYYILRQTGGDSSRQFKALGSSSSQITGKVRIGEWLYSPYYRAGTTGSDSTAINDRYMIFTSYTPSSPVSTGHYTLPISVEESFNETTSSTISSWFDHTSPRYANDSSTIMTIYDGSYWDRPPYPDKNCDISINCYNGHSGIDFFTKQNPGKHILAADKGTIVHAGWDYPDDYDAGYGHFVSIYHEDQDQTTLYGHLAENSSVDNGISVDDIVDRGQTIGTSSSTGNSGGYHLHFSVFDGTSTSSISSIPMDPFGWSGTSTDPWTSDKGYLWTTDPPSTAVVSSINPATTTNNAPVSINSITGINFKSGWDKESNLLGNWRLDESSGTTTVYDSSGNGYNGTVSGPTVYPGDINNSRFFSPSSDKINFGDVNSLDISQSSSTTISFWRKGAPQSTNPTFIQKEETSGYYRGYAVFQYNFSGIRLVWRIGQNDVSGKRTYCASGTTLPSDDKWHHYVITQNGGTSCSNNIRIFIDGSDVGSVVQYDSGSGNSINSTAPLYFGSNSSYSASGALDEVRIYNKVLSDAEIASLARASVPGGVKLRKTGQSDIICSGFTATSSSTLANGTCDVTSAATGAWDVLVTTPFNEEIVLKDGLTISD